MRVRFSLTVICSLVVLAIICTASDASAQDVFVTPIPNAPFNGVINVARSVVQPDGSIASFKTTRNIHRDIPFSRCPSSWTQATGTASGNRCARSQTSSLQRFRGSFLSVPTLPQHFTVRFSPDKT
jgi:hypothetical protein